MRKQFTTTSADETSRLAKKIGKNLQGGEAFQFKSDLGGGKTTFIKGLVAGFGSDDFVSSPTFTISFTYGRSDGKLFHHFDFYRLSDPGIIRNELAEVVADKNAVIAVEWGKVVEGVMPEDAVIIEIKNGSSDSRREVAFEYSEKQAYLFAGVIE